MPTSAPGRSERTPTAQRRAAGYTLIELLVALLVLGLCAGLVHAIATPGSAAQLDLESERLRELLALASTEARLGGKKVSFTSDGSVYRFHRYDDDGYAREATGDDPLRRRVIAPVAIAALRIDGLRRQALRIDFMPHAPPPAFELQVTLGRAGATVRGSALGAIETHVHAQAR